MKEVLLVWVQERWKRLLQQEVMTLCMWAAYNNGPVSSRWIDKVPACEWLTIYFVKYELIKQNVVLVSNIYAYCYRNVSNGPASKGPLVANVAALSCD